MLLTDVILEIIFKIPGTKARKSSVTAAKNIHSDFESYTRVIENEDRLDVVEYGPTSDDPVQTNMISKTNTFLWCSVVSMRRHCTFVCVYRTSS
jgi:hypothetical protein